MTERSILYFIPSKGEFLKTQPGTGDNLLPEDLEEGYDDYVLWSTFKPEDLGIDGELEMACLNSGMVLLKGEIPGQAGNDNDGSILKDVLEQAYGDREIETFLLMTE